MVLWVFDRFSHLSFRHYLVILVTVVVPVVFPTVMGYFAIECLWVRVAIDAGVVTVWSLFVVVVVSRLVERDSGEVNQLVAQRVDPIASQLAQLNDEHRGLREDMLLQITELERRAQSALQQLGGELPPKTVNVSFSAMTGLPTVSITANVSGGSRWARILRGLHHAWSTIWGTVWGRRQDG